MDFPEPAEEKRGHESDEDPAGRAPGGDRQIEGGQPAGVGFRARELSVADHARGEERGRVGGDLREDRDGEALEEDVGRPEESRQHRGAEEGADIKAVALEAEHEGGQIQAERQDPEEGDGGDFLAHLVGRRHEHHGAGGGEGEPEESCEW